MKKVLLILALAAFPLSAEETSLRSREVFRYGCANELGRREVTLFGNGTVRLLDGPLGKESMGLAELNPDEMTGALNRLAAEDLSDVRFLPVGVVGAWIERCEVMRQLPGKPAETWKFGRYDSLPLNLSRLVHIADDLAAKVDDLRGVEELPGDYEPRLGDTLKRKDGQRFRIVRFTADNKGVELQGVEFPFVLFVLRDEMKREFVALLARSRNG